MTGTTIVLIGSREYREGLEVALASLARSNPGLDADVLVLHEDLEPGDADRLALWHPRVTVRTLPAEDLTRLARHASTPHRAAHVMGALRAAELEGSERVIVLDADVVVLGGLGALLETTAPYATVMRPKAPGRPLRGVAVLRPDLIDAAERARLQEVRANGDYVHQDEEAGVLAAVLGTPDAPLPEIYNLDKRRAAGLDLAADDVRILHFSGRFKPWHGGEHGFEAVEDLWSREVWHPIAHWRALAADVRASDEMRAFAEDHAAPYALLADADLEDLEGALRSARADGDFERAYQAARARALEAGTVEGQVALDLGTTAVATSRGDDARVALALAAADPELAPRAWTVLAQLEWTYRDYDAAAAAAVAAMRLRPADLHARRRLERVERTRAEDGVVPTGDGPAIGHVAFYVDGDGNYGDVLLPVAVRASLAHELGDVRWTTMHAHQVFDVERARWANEHLDAIVVGGGGLFLPDTSPNGNSGWQWNVTDEALEALEIPLVVYTVGYNIFPGQRFHGTRFAESVRTLVSAAAFVGLRNHGSVNAVREIVGPELADKVTFLPCVTTVYGQLAGPAPAAPRSEPLPIVLLNIAYDRQSRRFGEGYGRFVAELAAFIRALEGRAEVRCLAHTREDERIVGDLRRSHGVEIATDAVYGPGSEDALATIGRATVVVGMRGHASMIPFGIGVPIVSLISHAKLRYFLEDIGHLEWGVEVDDERLGDRLTEVVGAILDDPARYRAEVADAQERLREVVDGANGRIAAAIDAKRVAE
ncbi:polysaccharide pyruvyl transferase family protein [Demequina rhizosphaerae]|uniref:polysaccharide pyruvyl transferase family protein n=1 Tax=Demequina rhizosphaerae TaxID=1638985 RepID=UPI00078291A4|nr:polysaccharide pyruvyl transferase family protein [Demequina rhizosphaerae]